MNWLRCSGCDGQMSKQDSVNVCVDDCGTARQHAAGWLSERSVSDDESWSVSPCYAHTAPHRSSSPTDADYNSNTRTDSSTQTYTNQQ